MTHHEGAVPGQPAVSQPVAEAPRRRWYTPLLAGDLAALWPAIVVAFLGVLIIAFGMSYHGLFVFGERIMRWPVYLALAAPIGLDVFSLVALLATFVTHDARWRVRAYCWGALLFTVALSITANAIAAYSLLDPVATVSQPVSRWGYAQVSAVGFAAVWPALSAVALHVLIVVRRHIDRRRDRVRQALEQVDREAIEALLLEAKAIKLAATGATVTDIVTQLGDEAPARRTVERWTQPIRDAVGAAKTNGAAKPATARIRTRNQEA